MSHNEGPSPKMLGQQIKIYKKERQHYIAYAEALERVLKLACKDSVPEVIVQTRAKTMSSFVEKSIRKFKKYPDPAKQFTDLCGGRVIVQTLAQVKAVQLFIERNFDAFDYDDKSSLLGEDKFGYRDMHYLVRLRKDRAPTIGFTKRECKIIGDHVAEVQVRSIVQHAWADILHDRVYKAPLKLSVEAKRTGALLSAIMEDGDRSFDHLAGELDGMTANYSAYASRENVQREIKVHQLLFEYCSEEERPKVALRLARLIAADGKWAEIVPLLKPYQRVEGPLRTAVLLELGYALCRLHLSKPKSTVYRKGQAMLEKVIATSEDQALDAVPNLRRNRGIHARALARLGWSRNPSTLKRIARASATGGRLNWNRPIRITWPTCSASSLSSQPGLTWWRDFALPFTARWRFVVNTARQAQNCPQPFLPRAASACFSENITWPWRIMPAASVIG